jgi:hypothetical protein
LDRSHFHDGPVRPAPLLEKECHIFTKGQIFYQTVKKNGPANPSRNFICLNQQKDISRICAAM